MKIASYANFQAGMIDDPSIEDKGGFEFASGMDIFSEPGVMKASYAMAEVGYGVGAAPAALPIAAFFTNSQSAMYIATGAKILISTGGNFDVLLTDGQGTIKGLVKWADYLFYLSANYLGRANLGTPLGGQTDMFIDCSSNPFANAYIPMVPQAGTLKIGSGRYVHSLSEALAISFQAMKLKAGSSISTLVNHFNRAYMANSNGDDQDSSVYSWGGTVLSTGSALPDTAYEMRQRGMSALFSDSRNLFGFPDRRSEILVYDGAGFVPYRKLHYVANKGYLIINEQSIDLFNDTMVFSGQSNVVPGIYQMKDGAICQAFVPAGYTPGTDATINVGFVKRGQSVGSDQQTSLYVGYYKASNTSYHIEKTSTNRQNNAVVKTVWH